MPRRTYETEKDVKNEVKKLLTKYGWFWWCPPGNGYGTSGVADFNALKAGVFLAVETKFGYNKPTKRQQAFLQTVAAESGFGFVLNEKLLTEFERWLDLFDKSTAAVQRGENVGNAEGAAMLDAIHAMTALVVAPTNKG